MLPFDITRANTTAGVNDLYDEQNHNARAHDYPLGHHVRCTEGSLDISTDP